MAGNVKRAYSSPARAAAAAETRSRIREAAARLFIERGYVATTMREVAAAAGVGERTLYDAFPTKAALFRHTLDIAVAGDEEPVRVADRPEITESLDQADPRTAIAQLVKYSTVLLERAGDLIMVSVQAAGADTDMRAVADEGARATREVVRALARRLHQRGALRHGVDDATAADILYALCSPHLHQLLRRRCGWTAEQYADWLREATTRELLG